MLNLSVSVLLFIGGQSFGYKIGRHVWNWKRKRHPWNGKESGLFLFQNKTMPKLPFPLLASLVFPNCLALLLGFCPGQTFHMEGEKRGSNLRFLFSFSPPYFVFPSSITSVSLALSSTCCLYDLFIVGRLAFVLTLSFCPSSLPLSLVSSVTSAGGGEDRMTKKMRKVPKEPSAPASSCADGRHRFKYESLLQDYMELHKEIEVKKSKVQEAREKRLQLLAVVRYLRRKYESLSENPYQEMPLRLQQPSHSTRTSSSLSGRVAQSVNLRVPNRESSETIHSLPKASNTRTSVTDSLSVNAPQYKFKKQSHRNSSRHPHSSDIFIKRELVSQDESYQLKEAANTSTSPVPHPHQVSLVSGVEMDFPLKRFSMNAEESNGAEITISRHPGRNRNRVGKRKISWQA